MLAKLANADHSTEEVLISYLPLSHVAAQEMDIYASIACGATVYFAQPDVLKVSYVMLQNCAHAHYTLFAMLQVR